MATMALWFTVGWAILVPACNRVVVTATPTMALQLPQEASVLNAESTDVIDRGVWQEGQGSCINNSKISSKKPGRSLSCPDAAPLADFN
jgi:hypothetical protein